MDILVTVPKGQMEHMQEKAVCSYVDYMLPYWELSRTPKDLKVDDHIFFVEDGEITRRAIVTDITAPYSSGRIDVFFADVMNFPVVLSYPGFRGVRYFHLELWMEWGNPQPGGEDYKEYHRILMGEDR